MKRRFSKPILIAICIAIIGLFLKLILSLFEQTPQSKITEAYKFYAAGEKATTIEARQEAFNKALAIYVSLEENFHPSMGNGKLYYNLGSTFYQLASYPAAILNGYKAKALNPRDEKIDLLIADAQKKLTLTIAVPNQTFQWLFFWHLLLSIPEKIQAVVALTVVALICFSLNIWLKHRAFQPLGRVCVAMIALLLASLAYTQYVSPIDGVLMRSTLLYRDAGTQYAPVNEQPEASGNRLEVLDVLQKGEWLKVQTTEGTTGFIPADTLRLI